MKAAIPKPVHSSYKAHRKQLLWQIILPVAVTGLLIVALIVLVNIATFRQNGDVGRWAAISTIWIVIPIMLAMLIFLAILAGLIYLLGRLLNITPVYTGLAQDFAHKIKGYVRRGADAAAKPILYLDGIMAGINAFFGRNKP